MCAAVPLVLAPRTGDIRRVQAHATLLLPWDAVVSRAGPAGAPPPLVAALVTALVAALVVVATVGACHCCTKWLGGVPGRLTSCSSLQQSYKQAGKVTPPSDANPDRLLVRCKLDGRRCLTTASHWANSCCGQQGWLPSDLLVGQPKKRAGMKQLLRLLQRHKLAGCRPPLYNVLPARALADPSTLDTVGCCGLYWVAWVPVALGWQTNND